MILLLDPRSETDNLGLCLLRTTMAGVPAAR